MHFKRLELVGFKSFAEQTALEFEPGVTAIVGPNGCGKSNVSDAIRWVLGEQSPKTLRGAAMEDVIFNGTATRDAVNFAEVSLTLANEARILPIEYDEVVISRRLFRSGESEYLVNKNPVRLKDVQDLLAGTGLGINNYSVIEQGKIDLLVSAKPENRREIFDEAAGITRYKSRKREALRKLDLTEQNLLRVKDIIVEVKRQIGSIERQAKKAENYKRDFERLKGYDVSHARLELAAEAGKKDALGGRLEKARLARERLEAELQQVNRELKDARGALAGAEDVCAGIRTRKAVLESELGGAAGKKALFAERLEEIGKKDIELETGIAKTGQRVGALEKEFADLSLKLETALGESRRVKDDLGKAETDFEALELRLKDARRLISETKSGLVENAAAFSRTQNEITKTESLLQGLESRRQRLRLEREKVLAECAEASSKCDAVGGEITQLNGRLRQRIEEKETLEASLEEVRHTARLTVEKLKSVSHEWSATESKLGMLREITAKHEGFSKGVRFVLDTARSNELIGRGVIGALADLVEIDRGCELALETALRAFAQSIVCVTDEDALAAAKLLREAGGGQATFVSAADLRRRSGVNAGAPAPAGTRPLMDFARPHPRIADCFSTFLEGTFVARDLDEAAALRRAHPHLVFVTAKGEMCHEAFIVGGVPAASEETLLFGRESRIRDMERGLVELSLEKERLAQKEAELTRRETALSEDARTLGIELPKLQVALADLASEQDHLTRQKTGLQEELGVTDAELAETEEEMADRRGKEETLKAGLERLNVARIFAEGTLRVSQQTLEEGGAARETILVEMTRLGSAVEALEERVATARRDTARAETELVESRAWLDNARRERRDQGVRAASLAEQARALEAEFAEKSGEKERLGHAEAVAAVERAALGERVTAGEARKTAAEDGAIAEQKRCHDVELELNALDHGTQIIRHRISANYQVDLDAEAPPAGPHTAAQEEEIERLREKISQMGPVNLVAIEEHDELKARYEFLAQEEKDLLNAKDDIHKAILKINRQTRELFVDAFTKIQTAFGEYYRTLFDGGTAELVLIDENNVLESGIEIIARPPGKKMQTISLLSGGEKALTAIALLFAVLKAKPCPFVILDEIDAPLDELNVQRFAGMLQEFVKGSQFIVITHNKRTMTLADVMYGITMLETGMSRVVSVKFAAAREAVALRTPRVTV